MKTSVTKRVIALLLVMLSLALFGSCKSATESEVFRIIVPQNWEMDIGDSRTLDYVFPQGETNRMVYWHSSNEEIASVDEWGRVTALSVGKVTITGETRDKAKGGVLLTHSVTLNAVAQATKISARANNIVNYLGSAEQYGDNPQKVVTRYELDDAQIPSFVHTVIAGKNYINYKNVSASDGATWTITQYGVLRLYESASNERDRQQRFMGDRYFYTINETAPLAIVSDGARGIWTVMEAGVTHIALVDMSGTAKATQLEEDTLQYVSRRGMVSEAVYTQVLVSGEGEEALYEYRWIPRETDNDGLWTAMYAVGEVMRYSVLKSDPNATQAEIDAARASALLTTEAVLLLANISMRQGTVDSYVRYNDNGDVFLSGNSKFVSVEALLKGGDYSRNVTSLAPCDVVELVWKNYLWGKDSYFLSSGYLAPYDSIAWQELADKTVRAADNKALYATRTRNLEGWIARTYSVEGLEAVNPSGNVHWYVNEDGTSTAVSTKAQYKSQSDKDKGRENEGYHINGERIAGTPQEGGGAVVDASGEIPSRLWNDLLALTGASVSDIVYKGDTSSDEIIGHLFLYKVAYDVFLGDDDEIAGLISSTMDRLAQHLSDNGYMLVDGTGQPSTWGKFNREYFLNASQLGGAPLTSSVALSLFKLAAYVTGDQKWEDEYRMAALDPAYKYAQLTAQYERQMKLYLLIYANDLSPIFKALVQLNLNGDLTEMLCRMFLNYSDEEMAMLSFYLLFQMEEDQALLKYYRLAIDQWWISIQYSENPLWYYIYQLAYPNKEIKDAYGNSILETAAWSLSRHPLDLRRLSASNSLRDDIASFDFSDYGIDGARGGLSYDKTSKRKIKTGKIDSEALQLINIMFSGAKLDWKVAAPDERGLHKFNNSTYVLEEYSPNQMEGGTTYTLPFWLGMYHKMLTD